MARTARQRAASRKNLAKARSKKRRALAIGSGAAAAGAIAVAYRRGGGDKAIRRPMGGPKVLTGRTIAALPAGRVGPRPPALALGRSRNTSRHVRRIDREFRSGRLPGRQSTVFKSGQYTVLAVSGDESKTKKRRY